MNAEDVLDPRSLSLAELREMRNKLQNEDDEVSYVRRVAQARVDLVRAEQHRRDRGEVSEDLPSELRVVLSSHLTGGAPRPPRPSSTSPRTSCPTSSTWCAPSTGSAGSKISSRRS